MGEDLGRYQKYGPQILIYSIKSGIFEIKKKKPATQWATKLLQMDSLDWDPENRRWDKLVPEGKRLVKTGFD